MTTPSGKLAWGQAGNYDAFDDRGVIAAVTGYRTGLTRQAVVTPGAGLNVNLAGGWLGVSDCGDRTSCVVGSNIAQVVQANPGPATGSRVDWLWVDVQPDQGTWSLRIIPNSQATGLAGLPLCSISVPVNANAASQMTFTPWEADLERRLIGFGRKGVDNTDYTATQWDGVPQGRGVEVLAAMLPSRWYRVTFDASCASVITPGTALLEGRMGIGYRNEGQPYSSSTPQRIAVTTWPEPQKPHPFDVVWTFRYPPASAPIRRLFDGRLWMNGNVQIRPGGCSNLGDTMTISVEDLGT